MSAKLKVSYSDGKKIIKGKVNPINASVGDGLARDATTITATGIKSRPSPYAIARLKAWLKACNEAFPKCAAGWELVEEKSMEAGDLVQIVVENPESRVPSIEFSKELGEPVVTYKTERCSFLIKKKMELGK